MGAPTIFEQTVAYLKDEDYLTIVIPKLNVVDFQGLEDRNRVYVIAFPKNRGESDAKRVMVADAAGELSDLDLLPVLLPNKDEARKADAAAARKAARAAEAAADAADALAAAVGSARADGVAEAAPALVAAVFALEQLERRAAALADLDAAAAGDDGAALDEALREAAALSSTSQRAERASRHAERTAGRLAA